MRTTTGIETGSFPVTGYDVTVSSMGAAADKAAYIILWNADPQNQAIGTLYGADGPFLFLLLLKNGQTPPPWVLGNDSGIVANIPPTAFAGSDQSIILPVTTATLVGSGLDPDGTITAYGWTKVSGPAGGVISSPTTATTGITSLTNVGTYVYMLTVTDDDGGTGTDTVSITVGAPVFAFLTQPVNQTIDEGDLVTITATINSNGTPNYTVRWYQNGAGGLILTQTQSGTSLNSGALIALDGDTFYITVTDSLGQLITSNTITVTVTPTEIIATFGYSITDPWINDTTAITIPNATTQSITHNANLQNFYPLAAQDTYILAKYPDTQNVKTLYNNGTNPGVNGTLPGDEFRAYTTGGFHWIVARVPRSFDSTQPINYTV